MTLCATLARVLLLCAVYHLPHETTAAYRLSLPPMNKYDHDIVSTRLDRSCMDMLLVCHNRLRPFNTGWG